MYPGAPGVNTIFSTVWIQLYHLQAPPLSTMPMRMPKDSQLTNKDHHNNLTLLIYLDYLNMPWVYKDEQGKLVYSLSDQPPPVHQPTPPPQDTVHTIQTTSDVQPTHETMEEIQHTYTTNNTSSITTTTSNTQHTVATGITHPTVYCNVPNQCTVPLQNTQPINTVNPFVFTCATRTCDNPLPQYNWTSHGPNGFNGQHPQHTQLPPIGRLSASCTEARSPVSHPNPSLYHTSLKTSLIIAKNRPIGLSVPAETFNNVDLTGMDDDLFSIDAGQLFRFEVPNGTQTKPPTQEPRQVTQIPIVPDNSGAELVIKCKICHEYVTTKSSYQLMLHMSDHNEDVKRYGCPKCPFKSAVSAGISNHVSRKHDLKREDIVDKRDEHLFNIWRSVVFQCFPDYTESFEHYIASETAVAEGIKMGQPIQPSYPELYRNTMPNTIPQNISAAHQPAAFPPSYQHQLAPGPVRASKKGGKVAKEKGAKDAKKSRGSKNNLKAQYPYGYNPWEQQLQYEQQMRMMQGMNNYNQNFNPNVNQNFSQNICQNQSQ